jgi:YVTN family beta-propeller protein
MDQDTAWTRRHFLSSLGYAGAAGALITRGGSQLGPDGAVDPVPTRTIDGVRCIKLPDTAQHPGMCDWTLDGQSCFFACQDTNNVVVLDRHRYDVDGIIPLETADVPWDVAMSPDGRFAYVSNSTYDETAGRPKPTRSTVTVIDVAHRREVGTITVGVSPNGLLVDRHRNRLWVANAGSDDLSVVDLHHHEVIAQIPVARRPFSMTQSPDGRSVVAVGFEEAAITVVDAESLTPGPTIPVGRPGLAEPHPEWGAGDCCYAAFSDDRTIWVTNFRTRTVGAVDLARAQVTDRLVFDEGEFPISIDCLDGRYGWVHGLNTLKLVDFVSRRIVTNLEFAFEPPIGRIPVPLDGSGVGRGDWSWEIWMGVTPDSSVLVVPLEVPGRVPEKVLARG